MTKRLRVLVVLTQPIAAQLAILRAVSASGIDLHMAGVLDGPEPEPEAFVREPIEPDFGTFHRFRARAVLPRGQLWWRYPGLVRRIADLRPDVVHVSSEPWGLLVDQVLGGSSPVVVHGADTRFVHGPAVEAAIRLFAAKRNLRRVGGLAWWNQIGADLCLRHGLAPDAPRLVAPFIAPDPRPFREAATNREALRHSQGLDGRFVVACAGRLSPEKGVDVLIRALARGATDDVVLRVIGDGPLRRELTELASALGLDVEMLGAQPIERMPDWLAPADVLVIPSVTTSRSEEQFGRVAVEAMHANVPLIVSECGALPEVVNGAGWVVGEGDVRELSDAIQRLRHDAEARQHLAHRGAARADSTFAPAVIAEGLCQLWDQVHRRAVAGR